MFISIFSSTNPKNHFYTIDQGFPISEKSLEALVRFISSPRTFSSFHRSFSVSRSKNTQEIAYDFNILTFLSGVMNKVLYCRLIVVYSIIMGDTVFETLHIGINNTFFNVMISITTNRIRVILVFLTYLMRGSAAGNTLHITSPLGNPRLTPFTSSIPRVVTPPLAVPPPSPSVDPFMSALAQIMSKLAEVSDRLKGGKGGKGDKAQCSHQVEEG